ncbi:helix-turn-helix domain-containing protein [Brevibacillus sp. MS2.2]|uniref:helix-turn-helix domain-containing protein n=1 Tax=Brevibacillus sp. MS2.2 TaxID=2738981 RepID=UPI00156AE277|nr:helix-turn-helix transcriptional regulator [Brevibacillus sp. MS2.2]NRR22794.1 helix-turn-helix transcriptional regulator [Brevibacillus sp. MS2.2]
MPNIASHVGTRIRLLRKNRGLTQEQLGERVHQPQSYIGSIERGEKNISLDTLERIAEALDVHPGALFDTYHKSKSSDQLEKDKIADYIGLLLKERNINEMKIISRLVEDVLKAFDSR